MGHARLNQWGVEVALSCERSGEACKRFCRGGLLVPRGVCMEEREPDLGLEDGMHLLEKFLWLYVEAVHSA